MHKATTKIQRYRRLACVVICTFIAFVAPAIADDEEMLVQREGKDRPVSGPVQARVVRVIDGDTIRARVHIWLGQYVVTNVRLAGIDTAEKRAHCDRERDLARQAEEFVQARLSDENISLQAVNYDKYGKRVVARVITAGGEDLSDALLSAGLARRYDGGHKQPWCDEHDLKSE